MNRSKLALAVGLSLLATLASCTVEERVVVSHARPAERHEVITVRPSVDHVWVRGHWVERRRGEWEWIPGHWERR